MAPKRDDETSHLRHDVVMRFLETGKLGDSKSKRHTEKCPRCRSVIAILQTAKKIAGMSPQAKNPPDLSHCELADIIARIYERSLSPLTAANFLKHIQEVKKSLDTVGEIVGESIDPDFDIDLQKYEDISLAEIALSKCPPVSSEDSTERPPVFQFLQPILTPRVGFVVAALLAIFIGYKCYDYVQTTHKIKTAESELSENYRIYYKGTPRLSGNYSPTTRSYLLSGDTATPPADTKLKPTPYLKKKGTYLLHALELSEDALENGSRSSKAYQVHAQIFMINGQLEEAESILNNIPSKERDAAILNDFGVLKFHQKNWQEAAQYFERAIVKNKNFSESYYNLALTLKEMDDFQGALSVINVYLELEEDVMWRNTALNLQKELGRKIAEEKEKQ